MTTHLAHPADGLAVCATPRTSEPVTTDLTAVTCRRCLAAD